jgi:hypothetical protein
MLDGGCLMDSLLLLILPLIVIELGLVVFALIDLFKRKKVRGGNKWIWLIPILFVSVIGPIIYLILGREEEGG